MKKTNSTNMKEKGRKKRASVLGNVWLVKSATESGDEMRKRNRSSDNRVCQNSIKGHSHDSYADFIQSYVDHYNKMNRLNVLQKVKCKIPE